MTIYYTILSDTKLGYLMFSLTIQKVHEITHSFHILVAIVKRNFKICKLLFSKKSKNVRHPKLYIKKTLCRTFVW